MKRKTLLPLSIEWNKPLKDFFRIMRITTLLLFVCMFQLAAHTGSAQNTIINVQSNTLSVKELFNEIERQTEYLVVFSNKEVNSNRMLEVKNKSAKIESFLYDAFLGTDIEYLFENNYIVLKQKSKDKNLKDEIITIKQITQQSGKQIKGVVNDERGEPIIGANIIEKGTTNGTITDVDGRFNLSVSPNSSLIVTYIGYNSQEIAVEGKTIVNIALKEDAEVLDEVVIVGYGSQKKVNLTGSVSTIQGDQISRRTVSQSSQALQGLAPGLNVRQDAGNPGADVSFNIRGIGTLGNTSPLVLIDGVDGSLNSVNVNDIESISVLKDAASAAIYGSRAANGVILVTTKRASADKMIFDVRANVGVQSMTFTPKYLGGFDFMTLRNEAYVNEGKTPLYSQKYIDQYKANAPSDEYPDTDWRKEVFSEPGIQQSYGITGTGGNKHARLLVSLNYINQQGNMINTGFERYGIRINTDITPVERLNFSVDLNVSLRKNWTPGEGFGEVLYQTNRTGPIYAAYYENKTRFAEGNQGTNPLAKASFDAGRKEEFYSDISAIGKVVYEPIDGLKTTLIFSPRIPNNNAKSYIKKLQLYSLDKSVTYYNPSLTKLTRTFTQNLSLNTKFYLNYDKKIKDHSITALAGYEQIYYKNEWFSAYRDNFVLPQYSELNSGDASNQTNNGSGYEWALQSLFGRLNYDYKGKYLLEANIRYDGSSRFSKDNRWGVFPSFSAGWRMSEEAFMEDVAWLSNLKLIGSWGKLGNQEIGNYPYISSISFTSNVYDHQLATGAAQINYSNSDITWEKTAVTNVGIDFSLFDNSLFGLFEYYNKVTSDILLSLPIPKTMGLEPSSQNAGKVRNRGWDLTLGYRGTAGKVGYSVMAMVSDVKNKVLSLKDGGPFYSTGTITQEGAPINSLYGYICDGIFQSENEVKSHAKQSGIVEAGDLKYRDINEDGKIDADDRAIMGNTIPRYSYSLNLTADYKEFDLSILLQGIGKKDALLREDAVLPFHNGGKVQEFHLDRWSPDNPGASFPRMTTSYSNNQQYSSFFVKSAAFLRLKNIQLGYSLPAKVCDKTFLKQCRFYISADNLFQLNNFWKGWDPEIPYVTTGNTYPQTRVVSLGLNVNF